MKPVEQQPAETQVSKQQQWLWFIGLWVLGVLSITIIAGIFRFFAQFAYQ